MSLFYDALIKESRNFSNPKLKDYCLLDVSWRIWTRYTKETGFRDLAHIIEMPLNILTPFPEVSTVKTYQNFLLPFEISFTFIKFNHACGEYDPNALKMRLILRVFYQFEECPCMLYRI